MFCFLIPSADASEEESNVVVHVRIDDQAITPITARFIGRAIRSADRVAARYLVIELDTPGGVVDATRWIVRDILASHTRVVVYVAPSGARAASAGLFLVLASHFAAMAPGTNIGAAHPVQIGGLPTGPRDPGGDNGAERRRDNNVVGEKIVNDTRAWARALAEHRGRSVELAERAVVESLSLTATEAERGGLVDMVASDFDALLERLDASDAKVVTLDMGWGQRLLAVLASPNLAFILLLLGFYGLLFEFYSGGFGAAGVLGAICIILAFVGLAVFPLNAAGVALIAVGLALLVAEAFVVSFGLLAAGGVVCLILGGLMLVDSPPGFLRVSATVVIPAALAAGAIALLVLGSAIKAHRAPVKTGAEALLGAVAVATEPFRAAGARYKGIIRVHGELWKAVSWSPIVAGDDVVVCHQDGLVLTVEPKRQAEKESS